MDALAIHKEMIVPDPLAPRKIIAFVRVSTPLHNA
jgi:hypothetical protein